MTETDLLINCMTIQKGTVVNRSPQELLESDCAHSNWGKRVHNSDEVFSARQPLGVMG